jgi:hypothetical protein
MPLHRNLIQKYGALLSFFSLLNLVFDYTSEVNKGVFGFAPAPCVGVIRGEVNVFSGFLFELRHLLLLKGFACAVEQWTDRFEGFMPSSFFDFFTFEF